MSAARKRDDEVDARYGQVYYSQAKLSQMADQAERLLQRVEEEKK